MVEVEVAEGAGEVVAEEVDQEQAEDRFRAEPVVATTAIETEYTTIMTMAARIKLRAKTLKAGRSLL